MDTFSSGSSVRGLRGYAVVAIVFAVTAIVLLFGRRAFAPDHSSDGGGQSRSQPQSQSQAPAAVSSDHDPIKVEKEPFKEVSAAEIAEIADVESANETHQQLAVALISELENLRRIKNRNTIRARLKPTAHKFYLLNRAIQVNQISDPDFCSLPPQYDDRVDALCALWIKNPDLAQEADDIYSQLNLLDSEHVPYLLRNWLVSNALHQNSQ